MQSNELTYQLYLKMLYQDILQRPIDYHKKKISETYGEILPEGVRKLLTMVKPDAKDKLLDLGSGVGKLILQFFLESPISEAIGIELDEKLQAVSQIALTEIKANFPDFFTAERKVDFILGNFLEQNWDKPTIVLIGSPCFGPSMLNQISEMIGKTSSIHTVLSLRPLINLTQFSFQKSIRVECSWDSALCYYYRKKN